MYQAAEVPGVVSATPIEIGWRRWRSPTTDNARNILIIGAQPEAELFKTPEIRDKTRLLTDQQSVLIDRKCRKEFGPQNGGQFSDADIGVTAEINGCEATIVGNFELGTGLTADGCVLVNAIAFRRFLPTRSADDVSFGLVRLKDGADADATAGRMRSLLHRGLPHGEVGEIEVLTRPEAISYELNRWIRETSIGVIFQLGVAVSFLVGTVIVYQVLSSDVAAHLRQYATLKAMGYTNRFLSGVVLVQAVGLAVLGFLPGLAIAAILYEVTSYLANIPIVMNGGRIAAVLAMTVLMCPFRGRARCGRFGTPTQQRCSRERGECRS